MRTFILPGLGTMYLLYPPLVGPGRGPHVCFRIHNECCAGGKHWQHCAWTIF